MTVHEVQAAAEGVHLDDDGRVEFMGTRFRMTDRVGLMPLMKFAMTAKQGIKDDDLEGLAAMYALIRDCIDQTVPTKPVLDEHGQPRYDDAGQPITEPDGPSEWDRFERHAIDSKAEAEDLFGVVTAVIQRLSARPTRRPGVSSAGPQTTSPSSKAISSSPPPPPARRVPAGVDEMVPVTHLIAGDRVRLTA